MRTDRIKLTTPEAFMIAFNRIESKKNYDDDRSTDENRGNRQTIGY